MFVVVLSYMKEVAYIYFKIISIYIFHKNETSVTMNLPSYSDTKKDQHFSLFHDPMTWFNAYRK